jgi:hypothetical protein
MSRRRLASRGSWRWRPWVSIPIVHGWLRENFTRSWRLVDEYGYWLLNVHSLARHTICQLFGHRWRQTIRGVDMQTFRLLYGRQCLRCLTQEKCPCLGCREIKTSMAAPDIQQELLAETTTTEEEMG